MAKTMLNQTMSRPILYAYAQEMIAKTPSKWLTSKMEKIEEFKACIPAIKKMVKDNRDLSASVYDVQLKSTYIIFLHSI